VVAAVPSGEITPADASDLAKPVPAYVKAFETAKLQEGVERLERSVDE
jgi:hypothetical protein